jgi:uncharacterized protein YndB with AHSA1/START domain
MSGIKKAINLEFMINTSPGILYSRLSTPSGLAEWFSDDVNVVGKTYTFIWKGTQQQATEVARRENRFIRFRWLDEEDESIFMEFRIEVDELTGDTALFIIDYCDEGEETDTIDLWQQQVDVLKHGLGSH